MKVGSDEFEKYLRKKKEDVLNKTEGGIINADNFKRLRGILESFSEKYNPLSSFCILIFNTNINRTNTKEIKRTVGPNFSNTLSNTIPSKIAEDKTLK